MHNQSCTIATQEQTWSFVARVGSILHNQSCTTCTCMSTQQTWYHHHVTKQIPQTAVFKFNWQPSKRGKLSVKIVHYIALKMCTSKLHKCLLSNCQPVLYSEEISTPKHAQKNVSTCSCSSEVVDKQFRVLLGWNLELFRLPMVAVVGNLGNQMLSGEG